MAIVQISRIQNRRGRELTSIGIPQLASGEIGWAIDTQKMYIGNGAVSEGAPAVGNTEILTQHSDLFSLADQYIYKTSSNLWGATTKTTQTLQSKLDQFTTVTDFGTVGDGLGTDDAPAIQAAIDALYLRSLVVNEKVTLKIPAGEYTINSTIYIPPLVALVGDGIDKTILITDSDNSVTASSKPMFATVNGNATPGVYTGLAQTVPVTSSNTTQARHIEVSGMTLRNNRWAATFDLNECARSTFRDLKIEGLWTSPSVDVGNATDSAHVAFLMTGTGKAQCVENIFENITVFNHFKTVTANHDANKNIWRNIRVSVAKFGWGLGQGIINAAQGFATGPSWNLIEDCELDLIYETGIDIENGNYNSVHNNRFYNVGNNAGSEEDAEYPCVRFTNDSDNTAIDNYFKRTIELSPHRSAGDSTVVDPYLNTDYVPEVAGKVDYKNSTRHTINIGNTLQDGGSDQVDIIKLPLYNEGVVYLDYIYESERVNGVDPDVFVRQTGTIELHYDSRLSSITTGHTFEFQGDTAYVSDLEFGARTDDVDGDAATQNSIIISCKNLIPITDDSFVYNFRVRS